MDFPVAMADDYFKRSELEEKRSEALNVRVSRTLKTQLEEVSDFLTRKDQVFNPDALETSMGDVVVRLLKLGIEGIYAQAKLPSRPTKEEVNAFLASLKSQGVRLNPRS